MKVRERLFGAAVVLLTVEYVKYLALPIQQQQHPLTPSLVGRNRGTIWLPKTRIVNPNYEDDDDRDDILLCDSNGDSRPDRRILHPRLPRGFPHRPLVSVEEHTTTVREEFPEAQGGEKDDCRLRGIVQSASLGTFGND